MASATGANSNASVIELPRGHEKQGDRGDGEGPGEGHGERAGGQSAHFGAGIFLVVAQIDDAIDGHGRRTRGDHGHYNPENLPQRGPAVRGDASGKQGTDQRERQREDGVLKLDHLEHGANAAGHRSYDSDFRAAALPVQRYIFSWGSPACARTRQTYCVRISSMVFGLK